MLLILGIIAALTTPPITSAMARIRADRAAQVIGWDIRAAYSLASRQRTPVQIVVDGARLEYVVRDWSTAVILQRRDLGPQSAYGASSISSSASTITIFPHGLAEAPFHIDLWASGQGRRLVVTRTGLVRVKVL